MKTKMENEALGVELDWWPYAVFFTIAYISAPLYVAIIVGLIRNRRMTQLSGTFYTLIISQGLADLFYIFCYTVYIVLSFIGTTDDISHFFKWTAANISYKAVYYSLSLRCLGVTLISFQRYVIICKWNSFLEKTISNISSTLIVMFHWLGSLVLIIPILTLNTIHFGCVCKRLVAMSPLEFKISTINAELCVLLLFVLCVYFYASTLRHIAMHRKCSSQRAMKKEIHLCVSVACLVIAFFLIFLYHLIQSVSIILTGDQFLPVRVLEPLFIGFLTFITPWTLVLSNREVSSLLKFKMSKTVSRKRASVSVDKKTREATTS